MKKVSNDKKALLMFIAFFASIWIFTYGDPEPKYYESLSDNQQYVYIGIMEDSTGFAMTKNREYYLGKMVKEKGNEVFFSSKSIDTSTYDLLAGKFLAEENMKVLHLSEEMIIHEKDILYLVDRDVDYYHEVDMLFNDLY